MDSPYLVGSRSARPSHEFSRFVSLPRYHYDGSMRDHEDLKGAPGADAGSAMPTVSAAAMERKIAAERAELLYASRLPMVVALILAAALVILLWPGLPAWASLGWLALIGVAAAVLWLLRGAYFV